MVALVALIVALWLTINADSRKDLQIPPTATQFEYEGGRYLLWGDGQITIDNSPVAKGGVQP